MAIGRFSTRKKMGELLKEHYLAAGFGDPVENDSHLESFNDHLPNTFGGRSPFIAVASGGTQRMRSTTRGRDAVHLMLIYFGVLNSREDNEDEGTEFAQDMIDLMCDQLDNFYLQYNHVPGYWTSLEFAETSDVRPQLLDDRPYLLEIVPIRVHVQAQEK